MTYDTQLADRVREYLVQFSELEIEEKKMFRGLATKKPDRSPWQKGRPASLNSKTI